MSFTRDCPSCGCELTYTAKSTLTKANAEGWVCNGCSRRANWRTESRRSKVRPLKPPQEYLVDGEVTQIVLRNRAGVDVARTFIDTADIELARQHRWYFARGTIRPQGPNGLLLYRHLTSCPDHLQVDHIDGDPLNNRRSNLRLVTYGEQRENVVRPNSTGFRNVIYDKRRERFYAKLTKNGTQHAGPFRLTAEEAAADAVRLRTEHFTHHNESRHEVS